VGTKADGNNTGNNDGRGGGNNDDRPASTGPTRLFPRVVDRIGLHCGQCGHEARYEVPLLVDWRDREAVDLVARCAPAVECQGCGLAVPLNVPVVVLRPGDPIPAIAGFPGTDCGPAASVPAARSAADPSLPHTRVAAAAEAAVART
jgi:hypothetical protein